MNTQDIHDTKPPIVFGGSLQDLNTSLLDELEKVFTDIVRNHRGIEANQKRIAECLHAVATGSPQATALSFEGMVVSRELQGRQIDLERMAKQRDELTARITVFTVKCAD